MKFSKYKVRISIELPADLADLVDTARLADGSSRNAFINRVLSDHFNLAVAKTVEAAGAFPFTGRGFDGG